MADYAEIESDKENLTLFHDYIFGDTREQNCLSRRKKPKR